MWWRDTIGKRFADVSEKNGTRRRGDAENQAICYARLAVLIKPVIPAKAGTQKFESEETRAAGWHRFFATTPEDICTFLPALRIWVPACAGMTMLD
jgi:hypothetical protein